MEHFSEVRYESLDPILQVAEQSLDPEIHQYQQVNLHGS